ncbi:MAG: amidohydrolase family protein [Acidimicrobiia bacterium]
MTTLALLLWACGPGQAEHTDAPPTQPSTSGVAESGAQVATTTRIPETAPETSKAAPADVVLHSGTVVTMDGNDAREAVAINEGLITAVGSDNEVLALAGDDTLLVDLEGRTVLPGLIDSHAHWLFNGSGAAAAVAHGWTTLGEFFVDEARLAQLVDLDIRGELPVRVNAYLALGFGFERFGDWYQRYELGQQLSPNVRIAGVKLFVDNGDRGEKLLSAEYTDNPGYFGQGFWTQEELTGIVEEAHAAGFQVAAHTGGDAAHDLIINAFESVLGDESNDVYRHRIEHVMILRDDQLQRLRALRLIASFQLSWFHSDWTEEFESTMGPDRVAWVGRWKDILDAGIPAAGSSDHPWGYGETGPAMKAIYQSVTRIGEGGSPPADWMTSQLLTVEQALQLVTVQGAYAAFEEEIKGTITVGKVADLIVLSENPLQVSEADLPGIEVMVTMVGGRVVHCSAASLCPTEDMAGLAVDGVGVTLSASSSSSGHGPELVLDGRQAGDSFWSSGEDAPQWIEFALEEPSSLEALVLVVFQNPEGQTVHIVEVQRDGEEWEVVHEFRGLTSTGETLEFHPHEPIAAVRRVRVTTTDSPSWPEWYEVVLKLDKSP